MRGGVQLILATAFVLIISNLFVVDAIRCDRIPEGTSRISPKSAPDNRFILTVSGNPERYTPNELYTISLKGQREGQVSSTPKFTAFTLVVEPLASPWMSPREVESRPVGTLQLYGDALTRFSESCPNLVTQTSSMPKSEVTVLWIAPPPGSGCISIKATVTEHKDVWFQDDGHLSYNLCENVMDNVESQQFTVRECCACNEAKYEITFEGLWSRHTHPKDFPSNSWLTRFSDVIGASHTTNYSFWEYGGYASVGLRQVATTGATRLLESELKDESQNIRTIIKARGISYPNVTGKTFAVFRVDRKHHLVSLVSMLDPSPDWIVGVSKLELCLDNCSWVENKIVNLYPWDAGIDNGITYISPESPTVPQERIRRINSSFPDDSRSPFFDPSGEEMKPLARLYLNRQRTYERSCSDTGETIEEDACEISGQWSEWSECVPTETCGSGFQTRQREYKDAEKANTVLCTEQVTQRKNCTSADSSCGHYWTNPSNIINPLCEQAEWGEWSSCSASCGRGNKVRTKIFKEENEKECLFSEFQETRECTGSETDCNPTFSEEALAESKQCPWSHWSVCMPSCGKGKQTRSRIPLMSNEGNDPCSGLSDTEEVECDNNQSCDIDSSKAPQFENSKNLQSASLLGETTTHNPEDEIPIGDKCEYGRWSRWSECSKKCGRGEKKRTRTVTMKPSSGEQCTQTEDTRKCRGKNCGSREACIYTQWSSWSPCSITCGEGATRQRTRNVHKYRGKHVFINEICTERIEYDHCHVLPCN